MLEKIFMLMCLFEGGVGSGKTVFVVAFAIKS